MIIAFTYKYGRGQMRLDIDQTIESQTVPKQKKLLKLIRENTEEGQLEEIIQYCTQEAVGRMKLSEDYKSQALNCNKWSEECEEKKSEKYKALRRSFRYHSNREKTLRREAERYERFRDLCQTIK